MSILWPEGQEPQHVVAIIGGAVSGSEAARTLSERGILCVVIEQNARPYGKIEDGLPRWHVKLRQAECAKIDENLARANVVYVPETRIGRDLSLDELLNVWGVDAVILASGAWRDRPLALEGVDRYLNRGLVYQNAFVHWFNHRLDPGYSGPSYEIRDGAIVVGGGLASIDVAKIINFELYAEALHQRGIGVDVETLEHKGIARVLEEHGLSSHTLGIKGCTLYYRRRKRDMPLASAPEGATEAQMAKVETARERIMNKVIEQCLVGFEECHMPVAPIVEDDRLVGLRFVRTEVVGGRLVPVEGSERDVMAPMVVSSVGSIPEPFQGIPTKGELFRWSNSQTGELEGINRIFGLGNVLTGKGNIKASRANANQISQGVIARVLEMPEAVHAQAEHVAKVVASNPRRTPEQLCRIREGIGDRWRKVGYTGDYHAWTRRTGVGPA